MIQSKKTCWIVTNGNAGVLSQALGLAEQMGLSPEIKIVQRRFPFSLVPPIMKRLGKWSINFTTSSSHTLEAPWPDLVIACGAQSVHFCLHIKKQSNGKTFCIFLQDPRISAKNFDLVIKMAVDSIKGPNVIESQLSLNRITVEKLKEEEKKYQSIFEAYSKPFLTVLIGGSTKRYKMTNNACEDLILQIKTIIAQSPKSTFLITPSRRTPSYLLEILTQSFKNKKNVYIHNLNSPKKPYFAMLSLAEKIFVTNDSVNMISEACSAAKEVYILKLLGLNKGKPMIFCNNVIKNNLAQYFEDKIHKTSQRKNMVNETREVAQKVKNILIQKKLFRQTDFK
jgi:mitochondrial fission protein ELM1